MKIKLALFFGLISFLSFGQEEVKLPSITPPSPDAHALTKYGDLPMNEFNGMVNYTIPLYTYKASFLELPISINYTGAGVKVDDLPTWVGINWTLNAGGVITRTVKDIPDETAVQRIRLTDAEIIDYSTNNNDGTPKAQFLRSLVENTQIDTEADMFNFSFGNYSGSFYLDENLNPILFKADSHIKVIPEAPLSESKRFKIITSDGVEYNFGGTTAIEETTTRYVVNQSIQPQDTYQGVTAFYLVSIVHPLNGTINFTYTDNLGIKIVPIQKIQKRRKITSSFPIEQICVTPYPEDCPGINLRCTNMLPNIFDTTDYITVSSRVLNPRYLTKIYSSNSNQEVLFESHSLDNINFKRVLDKISIKSTIAGVTEPIKTIDFQYLGFATSGSPFGGYTDTSKRIFLEKITFDKDNDYSPNTQFGRRNEVFEFNYNSPTGLPPRFSFSQDFAGYFNGKDNLSSLPNNSYFNPNNASGFADRTPVFSNASLGSLTSIYFPTGGYTEFEYESLKAKERNFKTILLNVYRNQPNLISDQLVDGVPRIEPDDTPLLINDILEDQAIQLKLVLTATSSDMAIIPQNEKITLTMRDMTTNIEANQIISMPYHDLGQTASYTHFENYTFLQGHEYHIEITMNSSPEPLTQNPFQVTATITYYDGYHEVDDVGVRLKKQTDFSAEGQPEKIKRYYYNTINTINPTIDDLPLFDRNFANTQSEILNYICALNTTCCGNSNSDFQEFHYKFLYLLSDKIDFSGVRGIGNYENVTISYGGDDFENGGVEKTFNTITPFGSVLLPTRRRTSPPCNVSYYEHPDDELLNVSVPSPINGNLIREKYFVKKEGVLNKITEKIFTYDTSEVSHINNIYGSKLYKALFFCTNDEGDDVNMTTHASNYFIAQYKLGTNKNDLIAKQSIDYIDPVPFFVTDESSYKKIETTETYEYGVLKGLPIKITATSSDGSINETQNYYVNQANELSGIMPMTPDQVVALNTLLTQNIVNNPVQVTKYNNSTNLFSQRTLYKNIGTVSFPRIVPEIIQYSKGTFSGLEDRVVFSEFDPYGNPKLVSYAGGTKTKYFYNSYNQVYMKIENYLPPAGGSGGEITDAEIIQSTTPCDYSLSYPKSFVSLYFYNSITHLMTGILDANCRKTIYEYDSLNRLKYIKTQDEPDGDIQIQKEFDSNYRRY